MISSFCLNYKYIGLSDSIGSLRYMFFYIICFQFQVLIEFSKENDISFRTKNERERERGGSRESILSELIFIWMTFLLSLNIWFQCRRFLVFLINNNNIHTSKLQMYLSSNLIILMIRKPIFCFQLSNHLPPHLKKTLLLNDFQKISTSILSFHIQYKKPHWLIN